MAELQSALQRLVNGLVDGRQDPRSGQLAQCHEPCPYPANYDETSCSAMHAIVIGGAVQRGGRSSACCRSRGRLSRGYRAAPAGRLEPLLFVGRGLGHARDATGRRLPGGAGVTIRTTARVGRVPADERAGSAPVPRWRTDTAAGLRRRIFPGAAGGRPAVRLDHVRRRVRAGDAGSPVSTWIVACSIANRRCSSWRSRASRPSSHGAPGRTRWTVSAVSVVLIAQMCRSWTSLDAGLAGEVAAHLAAIDAARHRVQRQVDRVAQQAPGADQDHRRRSPG